MMLQVGYDFPFFFSFDTVFFSFQLSIWLELQFEGVEQKFNASCWTGCWTLPVDLVDKYSSEIFHQHDGEQIESMAKQSTRLLVTENGPV